MDLVDINCFSCCGGKSKNMGADCSSCGCKDQNEFKLNEVQLDDKGSRQQQSKLGAITTVSRDRAVGLVLKLLTVKDATYSDPFLFIFLEPRTDGRRRWTNRGRRTELKNGPGLVQAAPQSHHQTTVSVAWALRTHAGCHDSVDEARRQSLLHSY